MKQLIEVVKPFPARFALTFWSNVDIRDEDECWLWQRSTSRGYGTVGWNADGLHFTEGAHRIAWRLTHGSIPDDLTVDHLCFQPRCCNPFHLRLLTNVDNAGNLRSRQRMSCPAGHPYDAANTYIDPRGGRRCRACHRFRMRRAS